MIAMELRRELARQLYVRSRLLRAVAVRVAYSTYSRLLLRWEESATPEAIASLRRRMEALFDEDFLDAEAGLYPQALIDALPWREYAHAAPRLFADLPRTRARIQRGEFDDLPPHAEDARYPRYYARNFHFQTDGYLGEGSAELYDLQVELLFGGTADVMRRRVVPPIVRFARANGRADGRGLRLLDVACGTGHTLRMLGAALPSAQLTGLDLSPQYLAHARKLLPRALEVDLVCDNAERLPFPDGHFDAVTSSYLFHEVPGDVRARILAELARVVRPGGLAVLADSLQLADAPELRRELLQFPVRFHEPYYKGYVQEDLTQRAREAGLRVVDVRLPLLTKVVVAERPLPS